MVCSLGSDSACSLRGDANVWSVSVSDFERGVAVGSAESAENATGIFGTEEERRGMRVGGVCVATGDVGSGGAEDARSCPAARWGACDNEDRRFPLRGEASVGDVELMDEMICEMVWVGGEMGRGVIGEGGTSCACA